MRTGLDRWAVGLLGLLLIGKALLDWRDALDWPSARAFFWLCLIFGGSGYVYWAVAGPPGRRSPRSGRASGVLPMVTVPRILVVEDDPALRAVLRAVLEEEDYEVVESGDGTDALAKLRVGRRPSLILLDLMMPGMNGWQFMNQIRGIPELRQVPIIVLSAYGSTDGVRSVGAAEFLKKPFDSAALLAAVRRHAARMSAAS
jgi:CheY-like chemotaxis protein